MMFWAGKGIITLLLLLLGVVVTQISIELTTGLKPQQLDADLHWAPSPHF